MRERIDDERFYNQDPPLVTIIAETTQRARKVHRCSVCNGQIEVGEEHTRFVYRDGDHLDPKTGREQFVAIRTHIFCPPI